MFLPRKNMPLKIDYSLIPGSFGLLSKKKNLNTMEMLNKLLEQRENDKENKLDWENPLFQDLNNGNQMPFFKIFGQKEKGKNQHQTVNKHEI